MATRLAARFSALQPTLARLARCGHTAHLPRPPIAPVARPFTAPVLSTTSLRHYAAPAKPSGPLKNDAIAAEFLRPGSTTATRNRSRAAPPTAAQLATVHVYYVDASGQDQGLQPFNDLLATLDRKLDDLVQVATRPHPETKAAIPVVKLISRKAQYDKVKAAKKKVAAPDKTEKEVQVGASVAVHDMHTKVAKAREFLSKGYRVKLTVVHKGAGNKAPAAKDAMMQQILDDLKPVTAQVIKPPEYAGRNVTATLAGKKADGEA
ncbi:hypothetical protein GGF31_004634 [Allomyces arbusculus]|nr:hypothetical protein GGF31_004634 [Allomyces arbusculus]